MKRLTEQQAREIIREELRSYLIEEGMLKSITAGIFLGLAAAGLQYLVREPAAQAEQAVEEIENIKNEDVINDEVFDKAEEIITKLVMKGAKEDYARQIVSRVFVGAAQEYDTQHTEKVLELFKARFGQKHYILTDTTTAEFIKYMANTFLAVKVSVVNEFYRMSKVLGANWNDALEGFVSDPRIGNSHTNVPGHDGKLGFGGTCFPKDINALITMGKELGVDMNTLEAAWKTNLEVRPEQDWKYLVGRAITPTPTPHQK